MTDNYSETFIRAHVRELPASVRVLLGAWRGSFDGWFPSVTGDRRWVLPGLRWSTRAVSKLLALDPERVQVSLVRLYPRWLRHAALRRYFVRERVQAVLAEYGPTGIAVMEACRAAGAPLIVHFHGADAYKRSILVNNGKRYRELFGSAAAIVAVSHDMESQLLSLGAPREKVHYNPCGVDTSSFSGADPEHALPEFIAVGRFVDKKAPHLTILAFKKVLETCADARLVMVGDGPLLEACRQLSVALGISGAVHFLGPRPHEEVAVMMRRARVFVQHSVQAMCGESEGDSEGTPVAVLEAGATGLPVVATKHAGIKDVIVDGETGFLVDEGDVGDMAQRMLQLALDPVLAGRLGRAGRDRICERFAMEKSVGNLLRIIEAAAGGSAA